MLTLALAAGACGLVACGYDDPGNTIKKLDPQGNVWYIDMDGFDSPTTVIDQTCASIGREVDEVTLANKYATEATVRCK